MLKLHEKNNLNLFFIILLTILSLIFSFYLYYKRYFFFSGMLFYFFFILFLLFLSNYNNLQIKKIYINNLNFEFKSYLFLKVILILIFLISAFYLFNFRKILFKYYGLIFYFLSIIISLFLFNLKYQGNGKISDKKKIKKKINKVKKNNIEKKSNMINSKNFIVILFFIICLILYYFSLTQFQKYNFKFFLLFFIFSTILIGLLLNNFYKETVNMPDKTKASDFIICIIMCFFAFIVRYYKLNQIPPGIPYDTEGLSLIMTSRIFRNIMPPFYLNESVYKITSIYNYLQSLWIKLVGNIELQNIRLLSSILGTLTVAVFYFFVKELFNRKVAVISSVLLILYLPHIIISRLAWLWVFGPFFGVIAFYLLFLGIGKNNPVIIGLSGVFTGLGLYFYSSSYVVPIVIIIFILLYNVRNFTNNFKYLILYLIPFLITTLPILMFIIKDPGAYFLHRTSQTSIFKLVKNPIEIFSINILLKRYLDVYIVLISKSTSYGYFNYPYLPLLNNSFSYFFILGLGVTLFNIKNYNYFFIFLILIIGIFPGVFYMHSPDPSTYRINMIALSVPVIASVGMATIWDVFKKINVFVGNAISVFATLLMFLFTAFYSIYIYFFLYPNDSDVRHAFNYEAYEAIKSVKDKISTHKIYVSYFYNDVYSFYPYINFFKNQPIERMDFSLLELYKFYNNENKNGFILMEGTFLRLVDILKEYFPDIIIKRHWNPAFPKFDYKNITIYTHCIDRMSPQLLFITAEIPYNNIENLYRLNINCYSNNLPPQKIISDKTDFILPLYTDFFVINGIILIPDNDYYKILCEGADNTEVWIDNFKINGIAKISKGLHKFKIKGGSIKNNYVVLKWSKGRNNDKFEQLPMGYIINSNKIFGVKAKYSYEGNDFYEQIEPAIVHKYYYFKPRVPLHNINTYEISWDGYINISKPGKYKFNLKSPYDSFFKVNNQLVFNRINEKEEMQEMYLSKGKYKLTAYLKFKTMPNIFSIINNVSMQYSYNDGIWMELPYYMYSLY